ncbi:DNA-binding response regulator [Ferruginivarius sediminum]|uniref:Phosphate regulon transcriptional regulatory protein PhoB n=2 Tax=Ferruginivarius sediminum TaxID=2661937 RepID=A0A369T7F4_9PROT|nr:DNA-binding response regulator [Ferruginivarius sediminum]
MPSPKANGLVLVIEDDRNICSLVETYLRKAGFETLSAHDGRSGLDLARRYKPGFVILDLLLPEMDGWDVCRELRRFSEVPLLILTAQKDEVDRVAGFTLGADDYVVKPFSPRELVERVRAILRRASPREAADAGTVLRHEGLELDAERYRLTRDGKPVALTPSEFSILKTLMSRPGRVFTREELLDRLHADGAAVVDRVIDVHVGKLRQKIERDPAKPAFIRTVRGVGYSFAEREAEPGEA